MRTQKFAVAFAVMFAASVLFGGCRQRSAESYAEGLPDLPAELAATLDPDTMATKIPSAVSPPQQPPPVAAAPCCSITDVKALTVNYAYTKCGPLRDFIVAPIGDFVVLEAKRETTRVYRLKTFQGKTILDTQICVTSQGPWKATLTENRACSPYFPVHSLDISAYGDLIPLGWTGGIENHPPQVGLVSCRQVSTTRAPCSGPSGCPCPSTSCPASQPCECTLTW